ncbi:hypothetical protein [Bacteroides clarus]|jgi:hypothetical protein|uniref:hypothetical protein n=1 Tax=Bacteroides clarus TaxID=626929 RepID=UPI003522C16E
MKEKSKYGMPSPISRAEFEHNVFLLVEDIERHKNNQSYLENRFWALGESLEHSRYLPNRRIELPTIDERMRLLSNMMDWEKYLPPVSLREKNSE